MRGKRVWQSSVARILSKKWNGLRAEEAVSKIANDIRDLEKGNPINLMHACSQLGVTVERRKLKVDALLHETTTGYVAVLNSTTGQSRQRFSLAHELGHVALHRATGLSQAFGHLSISERRTADASEIEDLCDLFAAELLMPLEQWKQRIADEGVSLKVIRNLMRHYEVSIQAAARRIIEGSPWKCLIALWEPVRKDNVLVELKRIGCWESLSGHYGLPNSIPNIPDFCIAGSPLYAIEKGKETTGTIVFPLGTKGTSYVAQSDLFITKSAPRVATILIPTSYGWPIIVKSQNSEVEKAVRQSRQRSLQF